MSRPPPFAVSPALPAMASPPAEIIAGENVRRLGANFFKSRSSNIKQAKKLRDHFRAIRRILDNFTFNTEDADDVQNGTASTAHPLVQASRHSHSGDNLHNATGSTAQFSSQASNHSYDGDAAYWKEMFEKAAAETLHLRDENDALRRDNTVLGIRLRVEKEMSERRRVIDASEDEKRTDPEAARDVYACAKRIKVEQISAGWPEDAESHVDACAKRIKVEHISDGWPEDTESQVIAPNSRRPATESSKKRKGVDDSHLASDANAKRIKAEPASDEFREHHGETMIKRYKLSKWMKVEIAK